MDGGERKKERQTDGQTVRATATLDDDAYPSYRCRLQLLDSRRQVPMRSVATGVAALAGVAQQRRVRHTRQHVEGARGSSVDTGRDVVRVAAT